MSFHLDQDLCLYEHWCRIHHKPLEYTSFGKPNPEVFKNAESILKQLLNEDHKDIINNSHHFETLYMIGDNPSVDVNGARQVCFLLFCIFIKLNCSFL